MAVGWRLTASPPTPGILINGRSLLVGERTSKYSPSWFLLSLAAFFAFSFLLTSFFLDPFTVQQDPDASVHSAAAHRLGRQLNQIPKVKHRIVVIILVILS